MNQQSFSVTEAELIFVVPGDSANSYLWHKINGTQADVDGIGDQMPDDDGFSDGMSADPLSQADIDTITGWIDDGANP